MKTTITRRRFLKTAFGTILVSGLHPLSLLHALAKPKEVVGEFRFSASPAKVNLGVGQDFLAWTYNGGVPGPEIRVREGEIIRVVLKNYLPEETTIHWHGVPVPYRMDGVPNVTQKGVPPGESFVYEFEAKPAGSFIYHSHVNYQLDQGLYGALIIEPSHKNNPFDREYTLVLEDWVMRDGGGAAPTRRRPPMGMMGGMMRRRGGASMSAGPLLEPVYDGYAINGRVYPETAPLEVGKGERVKVRILNASSATIYDLSLAGHTLTITHADGNPVQPVETDVLRIGMGERYDVEFTATNPGTWLLAAREGGFGEGQLRVPVIYRGVSGKDPVPPIFHRGLRLATYWDLQARYPSQSIASGTPARFYPQTLSGGMHSPFWTINNQVYPNVEPLVVRKDERVRIAYFNRSMMPHPMHLHGHFFKVVNPSLPQERWIWKDTVIVDPMQRVDIEFRADNPGNWFHHCHNLYHMEAGMANVVVYQP
jgi:FtsP/CotA-like multicopper oxidase with cupredoxin domain